MAEMISTERQYVRSLGYVIDNYFPEMERTDLPQDLRGKRSVIFGNWETLRLPPRALPPGAGALLAPPLGRGPRVPEICESPAHCVNRVRPAPLVLGAAHVSGEWVPCVRVRRYVPASYDLALDTRASGSADGTLVESPSALGLHLCHHT